MRTLVVTSEVTFVPENYSELFDEIFLYQGVVGLVILKNYSLALLFKAFFLSLFPPTSRLGLSLLQNILSLGPQDPRRLAAQKYSKQVYEVQSVNSPAFKEIVKDENVEILINARTREIYKEDVLQIAKTVNLNIHHGLLPDNRGLFCDLWALSEKREAGFSVHEMTKKIDAGSIYLTQVTSHPETSYFEHLKSSARVEGAALRKLLENWSSVDSQKVENKKTEKTRYFKNPTLWDLTFLWLKGFKL